ncbi:acetyl-CoA sensor PanZ family protein [Metapseudomonas otitidis]|uniref:acetyl-CoA sensor PanZ family protein n=1 Tax=Metapseudomonas otitidis TaxID=319939 RepID=UPI00209783EE|nr:acetyl-CoA sensor PanZ family protein [Pseudomonas otitidis]MCO7553342.1 PanM family protein [Pseudomonas otitidis]
MPVIVERPTQLSEQDRTDLGRIYADAPAWLLPPYADAGDLVAQGLAEGLLLTGRFNDRLLGAALLRCELDAWRLSHLCVRSVTRRRGVARRLLDEATRLAREAGCELRLQGPQDHLEAQALAARLHLPLDPAC